MQPQPETLHKFRVTGLSVRTSNAAEMQPATAHIGPLWARYLATRIASPGADAPRELYGVYAQYESDYTGPFTLTVGARQAPGAAPAEGEVSVEVEIEAGNYLVFSASGPMPQTVVSLWFQVWQYFQSHPESKRRYGTDFETYTGADQVSIHIGVAS